MSVFNGQNGVGEFIVTANARKAILAELPSRNFDGTSEDYFREMQNQYVLKGSFSPGLWTVKIDVMLNGRLVVNVIKPLEKRQLYGQEIARFYGSGR